MYQGQMVPPELRREVPALVKPEQLQKHDAHAEHIDARPVPVQLPAHPDHLWGHVRDRAGELVPAPGVVLPGGDCGGEAEVGDDGAPATVDEDVRGLDVSVYDVQLVQVLESDDLRRSLCQ